jgi:hypothetical protein
MTPCLSTRCGHPRALCPRCRHLDCERTLHPLCGACDVVVRTARGVPVDARGVELDSWGAVERHAERPRALRLVAEKDAPQRGNARGGPERRVDVPMINNSTQQRRRT